MSKLRDLARALKLLPKEPSEPFYKAVLHALPTMIIVSAGMFVLEHLGWTNGFEMTGLDALLLARSEAPSEHVMLVTIDDEDYRTLFNGQSPLAASKLNELVAAVAAGRPRVIGVDIDTSAPEFGQLEWPEAVWARDAEPVEHGEGHTSHGGLAEADFRRFPILGGEMEEKLDGDTIVTTPPSGLVIFPRDRDGVIRRYVRTLYSNESEPPSKLSGEVRSLPWAVARQYADTAPEPCAECERIKAIEKERVKGALVLNFAGDRYRFKRIPARVVIESAKQEFWANDAPLRDKIVLVGGAFRAARDEYPTPVGTMLGVELIAQAIESDLRGGGIRQIDWITALVIDIVSSVILLYINWRFPGRWTALLSLLAIVALSLLGSYLAFNALAYWYNFTAVLLSIWIHSLWEQAKERRELRHEVEHLKAQLAERGA